MSGVKPLQNKTPLAVKPEGLEFLKIVTGYIVTLSFAFAKGGRAHHLENDRESYFLIEEP